MRCICFESGMISFDGVEFESLIGDTLGGFKFFDFLVDGEGHGEGE